MNDKIPCIDCVCLPICRNKQIRPMFNDCQLIKEFCLSFVDNSSNRQVAEHMLKLTGNLNEILDRHLIPTFTPDKDDNRNSTVGLIDVHPDWFSEKHTHTVAETVRSFRLIWHVEILDQVKTRKYVEDIIRKDD